MDIKMIRKAENVNFLQGAIRIAVCTVLLASSAYVSHGSPAPSSQLGRECAQARGEQTGSTFAPCNHIATRDFAQARNHDASEYFAAQHKLAERKSSHDDASKHLWAQRSATAPRRTLSRGTGVALEFRELRVGERLPGDGDKPQGGAGPLQGRPPGIGIEQAARNGNPRSTTEKACIWKNPAILVSNPFAQSFLSCG